MKYSVIGGKYCRLLLYDVVVGGNNCESTMNVMYSDKISDLTEKKDAIGDTYQLSLRCHTLVFRRYNHFFSTISSITSSFFSSLTPSL